MKTHMAIHIDQLIQFNDEILSGLFDGAPAGAIREELSQRMDRGEKLFPLGNCETFNPDTGCPGHRKGTTK